MSIDLQPLNTVSQNALDLKVYPTLVDNYVKIELPKYETANLSIVSLAGDVLRNIEFGGGKLNLTVNNVPSGLYYINVRQGNSYGTQKL